MKAWEYRDGVLKRGLQRERRWVIRGTGIGVLRLCMIGAVGGRTRAGQNGTSPAEGVVRLHRHMILAIAWILSAVGFW